MINNTIKVFKALADQTRIKIVKKVLDHDEVSCQELMSYFTLSQPTLSHHFNKLIDSGVLSARKDGTGHYYSVNTKYLAGIGINVHKLVNL